MVDIHFEYIEGQITIMIDNRVIGFYKKYPTKNKTYVLDLDKKYDHLREKLVDNFVEHTKKSVAIVF